MLYFYMFGPKNTSFSINVLVVDSVIHANKVHLEGKVSQILICALVFISYEKAYSPYMKHSQHK